MLFKDRDGFYSKVIEMPNGVYVQYKPDISDEIAILENEISRKHVLASDLDEESWKRVLPTLETLSEGDWLLDSDGIHHQVMARVGGVGKASCYMISSKYCQFDAFIYYSANDLEEHGYSPSLGEQGIDKEALEELNLDWCVKEIKTLKEEMHRILEE